MDNDNLSWGIDPKPTKELEEAMDIAEDYLRAFYGEGIIREGDYVFINEVQAWRGYPAIDLNLLVKQWNLLGA